MNIQSESTMTPEQKDELRKLRIKRHNFVQENAGYIPIHSTPDATAWIKFQIQSSGK